MRGKEGERIPLTLTLSPMGRGKKGCIAGRGKIRGGQWGEGGGGKEGARKKEGR